MRLLALKRFRQDRGRCWVAELPAEFEQGDDTERPPRSALRLFEDGIELGPSRAPHDLIRERGNGAYSHWGGALFFSASDSSDPSANGRKYVVIASLKGDVRPEQPGAAGGALPVNYGLLASTPEQADSAAEYAVNIARSYLEDIPGGRDGLKAKAVLEIGPGTSFASTLVLKCLGAGRVAASDRFLAPFREVFHVPIYRRLRDLLPRAFPGIDCAPLDQCIASGSHPPAVVEQLHVALEELDGAGAKPFDLVVSNAVFEHLYHPLRALQGLAKVMKPGSIGIHQVDFRDHRSFDRPLEYLLMDEFAFGALLAECHAECGNRIRPRQLKAIFERAGFDVLDYRPNMQASDEYLAGFVPRLRACAESPYSMLPESELRDISAKFIVRKT